MQIMIFSLKWVDRDRDREREKEKERKRQRDRERQIYRQTDRQTD